MKNLLLTVFLFLTTTLHCQTVVQYDYMETSSPIYASAGWWTPIATATWATNISVSSNVSAVIYGAGNGSSGTEQDWYSMDNVTGLNPLHPYQLKFRLASQTFTGPAAATRGLDAADLFEVQVSTNGGVSYVSELRITGNSNAIWPYTSTGSITHNANGSFTNSAAPTGDVYQAPAGSTTTGPSTVTLNLPLGITQVAIDFFCRVNSAGEEWWFDNIELIEIFPLPIELYSFEGFIIDGKNLITWSTASENNNDYFILERSINGEDWDLVTKLPGSGNSTQNIDYSYVDNSFRKQVNYYRLTQVDYDGVSQSFDPIAIDNRSTDKIVKYINSLGQEVDENEKGMIILIYENGTTEKVVR
jgi:hypothetical protein